MLSSPCGAGNLACSRLSGGWTRWKAGPQPGLAAPQSAPVPGALQLLDLALHQVALERADVGDVQLPVEVIGFVQERARQQIFGGLLEHLAPRVPSPYSDAAAPLHLLPESGDAQTAFFALLLAIDLHDHGVDQHQL